MSRRVGAFRRSVNVQWRVAGPQKLRKLWIFIIRQSHQFGVDGATVGVVPSMDGIFSPRSDRLERGRHSATLVRYRITGTFIGRLPCNERRRYVPTPQFGNISRP